MEVGKLGNVCGPESRRFNLDRFIFLPPFSYLLPKWVGKTWIKAKTLATRCQDPDVFTNTCVLMPRKPIAFLTMHCLDRFVTYDHLAKPPLNDRGWIVVDVPWRDTGVCWNDFEAVIIRSPWDYHDHSDEFLKVIEMIDQSSALLFNPADVVRWNIDKLYLRDLERSGLKIVPTHWVLSPTQRDLDHALDALDVDELVLKPTIGAGAKDTFRLTRSNPMCTQVLSLYGNRMAMIQAFLPSVVEQGEWSLFYFGGRYSHTVLKTPKPGDFRVQEEYGSRLQSEVPAADLLELAAACMEATPSPTLYGRVDIVRLTDDSPAIMELELIEPSLYFPFDEKSPERFAEAIHQALAGRETADFGVVVKE